MRYKSGYKYQLSGFVSTYTEVCPESHIREVFISLDKAGLLTIKQGYAWDGPSGPTIDTTNFMRGSLVHDALYQLMRQGKLSREHRLAADRLLQRICLEDGMSRLRAWWVFTGVHWFADSSSDPAHAKKTFVAP